MNKKLILVSSLSILSVLSLSAQENEGAFYASVFGGLALIEDGTVTVSSAGSGDADFEIDYGYSAGLRLGYDFGSFRVEGEFSQMEADIDKLDGVDVASEISSYGFMLNALLDFDFDPIALSVGVGAGASKVEIDEMSNSGLTIVSESEDTVLSYQAMIRANYSVCENGVIGLSYRYLMTSDFDDDGDVVTGPNSDMDFDGIGVSLIEVFFTYEF